MSPIFFIRIPNFSLITRRLQHPLDPARAPHTWFRVLNWTLVSLFPVTEQLSHNWFVLVYGGSGSSVGITGRTVRGSKKKFPVGARFFTHAQTGPGAHPASCTMGTRSFPGVKRPRRGAEHPPSSSAEVENE
jgi:hypothetical protein